MESTATAKLASDSLMPPTPLETILTLAFSVPKSYRAATIASHVPPTSVLIITLRTFFRSWPRVSNKSPAVSSFCLSSFFSFSLVTLYSAISLACFSFLTTWKWSPALGTKFKPSTSTAAEGMADLILLPSLSTILLIFPIAFPETTKSPILSVPFWIRKVETEPLNLSNSDSITTPWAEPS